MTDVERAMGDKKMDFTQFWADGRVVVSGSIADGPNRGGLVVSATPREGFLQMVEDFSGMPRSQRARMVRSVCDAVRKAVRVPLASYSPQNDQDLMDDLAILMAAKLAIGDKALVGSGLFTLALSIDPDENKTWEQRGMLPPGFVAGRGFDERPVILR